MANGSKQLDAAAVRRGWLRASATGLLASLATFFALQAAWQPGVGRSLVQASLQYYPGEPATTLNVDDVRSQVTSAAAVQEALHASGQSGDSANVASWQSQLSVYRTYGGPMKGSDRVLIELPTHDEAVAVAVVQSLAQRYLAAVTAAGGLSTSAAKELAAARDAAENALAHEDNARRELDNATKREIEQLRTAKGASPGDAPTPVTAISENPAWNELNARIATLLTTRDDLLLNLTTEHPKVRDLDSELDELKSRLSSVPRYLGQSPAEEPPQPELELEPAAPLVSESQQHITAAQDAYATARAARLEAQAAVEVLQRSTAEASGNAPRFLLAQSAQAVDREPAVSPLLRYSAISLVSVLVLLAVALTLRPRITLEQLKSVNDVATFLRLPVVASVKVGGGR